MTEWLLAGLVAAYLCGSVPFGWLLTRAAGLGDIRSIGSGSIGATNVLRPGNKKIAAATLLLDALKGAAGAGIGWWCAGTPGLLLGGLAAVIGHLFPVWLKFRGGKGIATGYGVLFAIAWPVGLASGAVWLVMARVTRISSLSSLSAFAAAPVFAYLAASTQVSVTVLAITVLVFWKHSANIGRLLAGTEPRIGQKG